MSASSGAIERWFESVPPVWLERAQRLRELILESAPGMEERWMFKSAPFIIHNGWLCCFALQRAKGKIGEERLVIGFCNGVQMSDPEGLFALTDHKQIRHFLPPKPPARMNESAFRRLIDEAVRTNDTIAEKRKTRNVRRQRR